MADLDLDAILAKARAAKEEAGSGGWAPGERWLRHTVINKPGEITSRDDSPYCLISANPNFAIPAVLGHIAAACPDVTIALVERLRVAEAELVDLRRRYETIKTALEVETGKPCRL